MERDTVAIATPDDRATIATILQDAQRWLVSRGVVQWTAPFTEEWIEQKIAGGEFQVARVGGIPVGTLRLLWADPLFWGDREWGDAAYIHTHGCAPGLRGTQLRGTPHRLGWDAGDRQWPPLLAAGLQREQFGARGVLPATRVRPTRIGGRRSYEGDTV